MLLMDVVIPVSLRKRLISGGLEPVFPYNIRGKLSIIRCDKKLFLGSDVTVVAFLIFPTKTNSFNVESLKGHAITKGLKVLFFLQLSDMPLEAHENRRKYSIIIFK